MLKCPKCSGKVDLDDIYDIDEGLTMIVKKCVGHCLCCNTTYQWKSTYEMRYLGTSNLTEV